MWGSPELASIQWHRSEIKVETLAGVFFQAASQGNKKESPAGGENRGPSGACVLYFVADRLSEGERSREGLESSRLSDMECD